jgi:hypothetical protein
MEVRRFSMNPPRGALASSLSRSSLDLYPSSLRAVFVFLEGCTRFP